LLPDLFFVYGFLYFSQDGSEGGNIKVKLMFLEDRVKNEISGFDRIFFNVALCVFIYI